MYISIYIYAHTLTFIYMQIGVHTHTRRVLNGITLQSISMHCTILYFAIYYTHTTLSKTFILCYAMQDQTTVDYTTLTPDDMLGQTVLYYLHLLYYAIPDYAVLYGILCYNQLYPGAMLQQSKTVTYYEKDALYHTVLLTILVYTKLY